MTEQYGELAARLARFARQVGRGQPAVGGECICGGLFLAYTAGAHGESVAHTKPTCEDFQKYEPDEYLYRVRTHKESKKHGQKSN